MTDDSKLWLFGGKGFDKDGSVLQLLSDLWYYDINEDEWVFVSGAKKGNKFGRYGTKQVASSSNRPGARTRSMGCVDRNEDSLYLFGGFGLATDGKLSLFLATCFPPG